LRGALRRINGLAARSQGLSQRTVGIGLPIPPPNSDLHHRDLQWPLHSVSMFSDFGRRLEQIAIPSNCAVVDAVVDVVDRVAALSERGYNSG
jgi:hypothetical protein